MNTQTKNTPAHTPLRIEPTERPNAVSIYGANGFHAVAWGESTPAGRKTANTTAENIVRAVNHHEELVATLTEVESVCEAFASGANVSPLDALGKARALLAKLKAEGGK